MTTLLETVGVFWLREVKATIKTNEEYQKHKLALKLHLEVFLVQNQLMNQQWLNDYTELKIDEYIHLLCFLDAESLFDINFLPRVSIWLYRKQNVCIYVGNWNKIFEQKWNINIVWMISNVFLDMESKKNHQNKHIMHIFLKYRRFLMFSKFVMFRTKNNKN